MKIKKYLFPFYIILFCSFSLTGDVYKAPSLHFDLTGLKLQVPGPVDIKELNNYASRYFYLTTDSLMCFTLDASEQGHTANSDYVRSELRHITNWSASEKHYLKATLKVNSDLHDYKVTVLQIHGITEDNKNAPPLLRIAVNNNNLYCFVKTDNSGDHTEKTLLKEDVYNRFVTIEIIVENNQMNIKVNGQKTYSKDLHFWEYKNYFKLGCYPQVHQGIFSIYFKSFDVT